MTVLLPTTTIGLRRRGVDREDEHGELVRGLPGPLQGPWPGRVRERPDGSWSLGVDVAAWPIRRGDYVVDAAGNVYTVLTAERLTHAAADDVDYVRVEARERRAGGTETPESSTEWTKPMLAAEPAAPEPTLVAFVDSEEVPLAVAIAAAWE